MFEFIVLGIIPGTNIQVTFWWYLVIILSLMIFVEKKLHMIHKNQIGREVTNSLSVFTHFDLTKDFVRIALTLREHIVFSWKFYFLKIIQLFF